MYNFFTKREPLKTTIHTLLFRALSVLTFVSFLVIPSISLSDVPILQPGAPGEATQELDAETAVKIANSSYTVADVEFMLDMIIHHHQAL